MTHDTTKVQPTKPRGWGWVSAKEGVVSPQHDTPPPSRPSLVTNCDRHLETSPPAPPRAPLSQYMSMPRGPPENSLLVKGRVLFQLFGGGSRLVGLCLVDNVVVKRRVAGSRAFGSWGLWRDRWLSAMPEKNKKTTKTLIQKYQTKQPF